VVAYHQQEDAMNKSLFALAWFVLAAATASAQATFPLTSPAFSGRSEVGFDSKLVSAGRLDPAYNGPVSLPFAWSGLPAGTKALALVYDDPDARLVMKAFGVPGEVWTHWAVADIDPSLGGLKAGASLGKALVQGTNTFGQASYRGPAPPADVPAGVPRPIVHVYRLTVYALSAATGLKTGFSLDELHQALQDRVIGIGQLLLSWSN
jgi:hypothetical protein